MSRRKAKNQKRSTTSINVGQNIYKARKSQKSIDDQQTQLRKTLDVNSSFKTREYETTARVYKQNGIGNQGQSRGVVSDRLGDESNSGVKYITLSDQQQKQPNSQERRKYKIFRSNVTQRGANITTAATSLDQNDLLLRSSVQLKQFMKFPKEIMNEKTLSTMLEDVPSTLESKFDTPGPGQYEIRGQFSRSVLSGSRLVDTDRFKYGQHTGNATDRTTSVLSNTINTSQYNEVLNILQNPTGNFGLSYQKLAKKFFKEFEGELLGRHSPGPSEYCPNMMLFKKDKHDSKSFPLEKRECPLVPREQVLQGDLSPMSYNLQNKRTAFEKIRSNLKYFGSKANRRIDVRLFGQAHADSIKIGWH
ncbi:hypothetical protein FGO68_gene1967 [Halteria grandinella]|uniref:Uncharacterized protein n=1 Tax=Halteria grandinella TaxID=5974 RepID=A0A8J8NA77_HALGN|nr:hypothetical protein FGO68_gene1967 [Halteria grandinella]